MFYVAPTFITSLFHIIFQQVSTHHCIIIKCWNCHSIQYTIVNGLMLLFFLTIGLMLFVMLYFKLLIKLFFSLFCIVFCFLIGQSTIDKKEEVVKKSRNGSKSYIETMRICIIVRTNNNKEVVIRWIKFWTLNFLLI